MKLEIIIEVDYAEQPYVSGSDSTQEGKILDVVLSSLQFGLKLNPDWSKIGIRSIHPKSDPPMNLTMADVIPFL